MNLIEKQMIETLRELREKYHVTRVKAEFEAEGTRLEEAMRLKEISLKAGLDLHLKIGGCEAIKDMRDARNLGIVGLIAPMIETPYALKKYIDAAKEVFTGHTDIQFLVNIETITGVKNFAQMLQLPEIDKLAGIVIGRVDLTASLGWERDAINSQAILEMTTTLATQAKQKGLKVIVGGGVSAQSLPFFQALPAGVLDGFETRKIVFQCPSALENTQVAFAKAIEFEWLWLQNKKNYYGSIYAEDERRIEMIEKRYRKGAASLNFKEI